jgi:hypothetical protein
MSGESNIGGTVCGFLFGFIAGLAFVTRGLAPHWNAGGEAMAATPGRWAVPLEGEDEMETARR